MGHTHVNKYWLWSVHTECKRALTDWQTSV